MPAISVIVPVYNVERYLPLCIDSIRNQTFKDIEIICVVDGSTDGSEAILRLYEKVEPRLRIVCKENGGLSSARNAGIDAACAPILMFVDSDDEIVPEACITVMSAFEALDIEMLTFGAKCTPDFDANDWVKRVLTPSMAYYESFDPDILFKEQSHPYVWRTAVSRALLEREQLRFDESVRFGEDEIFHFAAYPKAHGVAFIPDHLYMYRVARPNSLMATRTADNLLKCREHLAIARRICEIWRRYGLIEECGVQITEWAAEFTVYHCMISPIEDRLELYGPLQALLGEYLRKEYAYGMWFGPPLRELCAALIEGASDEKIEELRAEYLSFIRYVPDDGDPSAGGTMLMRIPAVKMAREWRKKRRSALDETRRGQLDDLEAAARERSLEQLRCEVAACVTADDCK